MIPWVPSSSRYSVVWVSVLTPASDQLSRPNTQTLTLPLWFVLSFGILPLETPSPGDGSYLQNYTNSSSVIDVPSTGTPSKKVLGILELSCSSESLTLHFKEESIIQRKKPCELSFPPRETAQGGTSPGWCCWTNLGRVSVFCPPPITEGWTNTDASKQQHMQTFQFAAWSVKTWNFRFIYLMYFLKPRVS